MVFFSKQFSQVSNFLCRGFSTILQIWQKESIFLRSPKCFMSSSLLLLLERGTLRFRNAVWCFEGKLKSFSWKYSGLARRCCSSCTSEMMMSAAEGWKKVVLCRRYSQSATQNSIMYFQRGFGAVVRALIIRSRGVDELRFETRLGRHYVRPLCHWPRHFTHICSCG